MYLASGKVVPDICVTALEELELIWPGASLRQARGAIVNAVLTAYTKTHPVNHSCDTCGAMAGAWCRTREGQILDGYQRQHKNRQMKAREVVHGGESQTTPAEGS
jgi:hypothetical protein